MFGAVQSGFGYWDAGAWILMCILVAIYVGAIRSMGRQDYKKGTPQDEIFYSGNDLPDVDTFTVPASASYWGFREALKTFYKYLMAMHTGNGADYIGYFLLTGALLFAFILL